MFSNKSWLAVGLAVGPLAGAACAQFGGPAKVVVEAPKVASVAPVIELPGTALPRMRSNVAAAEEGVVAKRFVSFGDTLKAGDPLVSLEPTRSEAKREEAAADLAEAEAKLAELEAGERAPAIAAARAELARARASLADARLGRERFRQLMAGEATTQGEVDEANRRFEVASADFDAAGARLSLLRAGTRSEQVAAQEARRRAAAARLMAATRAVSDQVVRAPFAGKVAETMVEVGDWVTKGGEVAMLVNAATLDVVVLVPQARYGTVEVGRPAQCVFPTAAGDVALTGTVVALGAQTTLRGRTIPVTVRIANEAGKLIPGMSARVELPIGPEEPRLLVSKDAILRVAGAPPRLFVLEDGKAAMRVPELGREVRDAIVVLTGVGPSDQVVVRGNERLQPGGDVVVSAPSKDQQ